MKSVALVSTFGPNIRGVSPYADSLSAALVQTEKLKIKKVDYSRGFPRFLVPAGTSYEANNALATINYLSPSSWDIGTSTTLDILHIQYWSPAFLPVILGILSKARNKRIKTLVTWHNPKPHENFPLLKQIERWMTSLCDGIICHTDKGKELILQSSPKSKVMVCHHGCSIQGIKAPSFNDFKLCNLSQAYRYVLFFGNIRPYKGVDTLLDAWAKIAKSVPDTRLIIAGRLWGRKPSLPARWINSAAGTTQFSNSIENKLAAMSDSTSSDLSFISEEKLAAYLRIASLSVFPYHSFESQSGAASLAAGTGTPVVTTGVGGLSDLTIDNRFIVNERSPRNLADVLLTRLSDELDYRQKQLHIAERYSWDSAAEKHIDFYQNL